MVMDSNTTNNLREYGKHYWNQMINTQKSNSIKNIHQALLNSRKKVIIIPWPTNIEFKKQWSLLVVQYINNNLNKKVLQKHIYYYDPNGKSST